MNNFRNDRETLANRDMLEKTDIDESIAKPNCNLRVSFAGCFKSLFQPLTVFFFLDVRLRHYLDQLKSNRSSTLNLAKNIWVERWSVTRW